MSLWTRTTYVPLNRCINKALQPVKKSAEYQMARSLAGIGGKTTPYYNARTGRVNWGEVMFWGDVPAGFQYWESPWMSKIRPIIGKEGQMVRTLEFPDLLETFRRIILASQLGWVGRPVPAIRLQHEDEALYIYLDGNHRMAAMALWGHSIVPVRVVESFTWEQTLDRLAFNAEKNYSYFPGLEAGARRWWDQAWEGIRCVTR